MAKNEEQIKINYKDSIKEDGRATWSRACGLEFFYTKKILGEYINENSSVIELGCAAGYYGMYLADKCKEYVGVDITPENIELFSEKIAAAKLTNVSAQIGDATDLKTIADERFDVVLVLGPMYHLSPDEREKVFSESKRICKNEGILAFAYISPYGAYLKGIYKRPEYYPNAITNEYILEKYIDDLKPDVFFYSVPEAIAQRAAANGLTVIKNIGVDFNLFDNSINSMNDEQFNAFIKLNDHMTECQSCTGLSMHALLICRKTI